MGKQQTIFALKNIAKCAKTEGVWKCSEITVFFSWRDVTQGGVQSSVTCYSCYNGQLLNMSLKGCTMHLYHISII